MPKTRENDCNTNCVLCSHSVRSEVIPLRGTKFGKTNILTLLGMLLPREDFLQLCDEKLFPDPQVCTSCYHRLKKIPNTVFALQNLLGKPLNIQLYKPSRQAWVESSGFQKPLLIGNSEESKLQLKQHKCQGSLGQIVEQEKCDNFSFKEEELHQYDVHISKRKNEFRDALLPKSEKASSYPKDKMKALDCQRSETSEKRLYFNKELIEALSQPDSPNKDRKKPVRQAAEEVKAFPRKMCRAQEKNRETSKKYKHALKDETAESVRQKRKCVRLKETKDLITKTRALKDACIIDYDQSLESYPTSEISATESEDEYTPPSLKVANEDTNYSEIRVESNVAKKNTENLFDLKQRALKRLNQISRIGYSESESLSLAKSKPILQDLAIKNDKKRTKSTRQPKSKSVMIQCIEKGCSEKYSSWDQLAHHLKYSHFDGCLPDSGESWLKLSMVSESRKVKGEAFVHECTQDGCGLTFTSERSLQEHGLFHDNKMRQICGFPDCPKAFKLPQSLKMHLQTHRHSLESTLFRNIKRPKKNIPYQVEKKPPWRKMGNNKAENGSKLSGKECSKIVKEGVKCELCGKCFTKEISLIRHKKRMHKESQKNHHKCPYQGCDKSFHKKEKLEIHMCEHSPERRLFCEKCGQTFSCQRYLDVHLKIHLKNEAHAANPPARSIPCEEEGCHKMFTTRENMKSHVLNQHRGRKPCSRPGVFYPCTFPGCGKKFSFRSTLYRHKKLVHKGGDYKLGRRIVQYPCTFEGGCDKVFNRKNLLEEHLVMDHGKSTPQRLLPLRNKAQDFTEQVCPHCGMVLTQALLPRHIELYHGTVTVRNLNENKSFPCHLEGCVEIFNTQEDRMEHVQSHIASPLHSCQIEGCKEVFYLEKNLDNHLWNHSKEPSTCDFEGCSQTFDDQLELAKHSKVHYNGKIKCPWPNCDAWLTETGQVRPHFIAHSKALHASGQSDYVCEVCQLAFSSRWGLMIHKRMHGEEAAAVVKPTLPRLAKFSCEEPECPATFCDQKGFFDHFLYHYTKKPCVCEVDGCNQNFSNLITLAKHTKVHFDGKYQCPWQDCQKLFASPYIVKRHVYCHIVGKSRPTLSLTSEGQMSCESDISGENIEVQQGKWPFPCSQCFMAFRSKSNLKSHMEYHDEKSEYVCPTCGKKGKHNHAKASLAGKKPDKNQTCDQCGAKYATISGLKFHLLQKHNIGKWPFKCSYCDKGFVSSREMQRHLPSHTKEKPFACDVCGARFASHTGHRAHMRRHAGQKYICEIEGCGKIYTTAVSLRGHMAQHAGFSKTCSFCGKTYKNPYGHKCKASREGKKKLPTDSTTELIQGTQPGSSTEHSETSLHELQPSNTGLHPQQHQTLYYHNMQHQVLEAHQQQNTQFQHYHHLRPHQQTHHHSQYIVQNGGAHSQASEPFRPILPGSVPQNSMLASPGNSSIQQPQMILMAPQMLPVSGASHSSMSLMAIPHNSSVPLHHHPHPQHHSHSSLLHSLPPPPPPQHQSLGQTTTSNTAGALSHINLLHQGILTLPHHSSVLQMHQHPQHQPQTPQHLNSSSSSALTTIGSDSQSSHNPHRASQGEPPSSNVQGDYVCNNYVVFWDGQM